GTVRAPGPFWISLTAIFETSPGPARGVSAGPRGAPPRRGPSRRQGRVASGGDAQVARAARELKVVPRRRRAPSARVEGDRASDRAELPAVDLQAGDAAPDLHTDRDVLRALEGELARAAADAKGDDRVGGRQGEAEIARPSGDLQPRHATVAEINLHLGGAA